MNRLFQTRLPALFTAGLLGLFCISPLAAANDEKKGEAKFSGYIEFEARYYPQDALFSFQDDSFGSIASELDIYWQSANENHAIQFKPFGRITTAEDGNRDHADIRELFYRYSEGGFQFQIGLNKVYWGVTESAHLVDIINQTDNVESFGGEDKLGQPMVAFGFEESWGNLDFYILPYFRERSFSEGSERNRFFSDLIEKDSQFESEREEKHVDYAIRWAHYIDNLDFAFSYFNGTNRAPLPFINTIDTSDLATLAANPSSLKVTSTSTYYEQLEQTGLELQYLIDDWALKLEATHKSLSSGSYNEAVAGFEYTLSDLNPWGQDIGFLVEYLWNDRKDVSIIEQSLAAVDRQFIKELSQPLSSLNLPTNNISAATIKGEFLSPFNNDIFVGMRFTLNNIDDTNFLAGVIVDADTQEMIGSFEGSTRIGDNIRISMNAYIISNVKGELDSAFGFFRRDDFIEAKLQWYF